MLLQQPPQVGGRRMAGAVQGQGFDTRGDHGRKGSGSGMVYTPSLETGTMPAICGSACWVAGETSR
jgi:hypothetical protein